MEYSSKPESGRGESIEMNRGHRENPGALGPLQDFSRKHLRPTNWRNSESDDSKRPSGHTTLSLPAQRDQTHLSPLGSVVVFTVVRRPRSCSSRSLGPAESSRSPGAPLPPKSCKPQSVHWASGGSDQWRTECESYMALLATW